MNPFQKGNAGLTRREKTYDGQFTYVTMGVIT